MLIRQGFHTREVKKVLLLLDNESWVVAMVPDQFQAVVDAFVAGNVDQGIFQI